MPTHFGLSTVVGHWIGQEPLGTSLYQDRKYDVGQRLLTLRARTRLTQTDLAGLMGVNRRSIQNWEAGAAYPKEDRLLLTGIDCTSGWIKLSRRVSRLIRGITQNTVARDLPGVLLSGEGDSVLVLLCLLD